MGFYFSCLKNFNVVIIVVITTQSGLKSLPGEHSDVYVKSVMDQCHSLNMY